MRDNKHLFQITKQQSGDTDSDKNISSQFQVKAGGFMRKRKRNIDMNRRKEFLLMLTGYSLAVHGWSQILKNVRNHQSL